MESSEYFFKRISKAIPYLLSMLDGPVASEVICSDMRDRFLIQNKDLAEDYTMKALEILMREDVIFCSGRNGKRFYSLYSR